MGEHRVDQLASRKQPVPGPLPAAPVEIAETRPAGAPAHRRLSLHRRRFTRRLTRALKTRHGRWALIGLACIAVLLVGLLAQGFLSSPAPSVGVPDAAGGTGALPSTVSTSPSPVKSKPAKDGKSGLVQDPVAALRARFPDNPLNHLDTHALHQVTISASAPGQMAVVGYLVPTGLGSSYGTVDGHRSSWSLSEQALGGGYLAAVFIQTGKSGIPITCRITVDGKVKSTETTSGSYGRALCLG